MPERAEIIGGFETCVGAAHNLVPVAAEHRDAWQPAACRRAMTHVDRKAAALMADHVTLGNRQPRLAAKLCGASGGSGLAVTERRAIGDVLCRWLWPFPARHRGIGRWQGRVVCGIYFYLGVKLALQER